jgi:hypothetical protein
LLAQYTTNFVANVMSKQTLFAHEQVTVIN